MSFSECSLSDFQLLDELFRSNHGAVYKAKHKATGRIVVLKERACSEIGKYKEITHEVGLLSKLHHPNVIQLLGHFITDIGRLYIILEYAPYGDLHKLIVMQQSRKRNNGSCVFSSGFIFKVLSQLANAISYLHSLHIIHRDLKSLNILICQSPNNDGSYNRELSFSAKNIDAFLESDQWVLKISDFGIGRRLHYAQQLLHTFYGTPLYLSPEVCLKESYSFAADMWALGIILFEIVSLKPPFVENNMIALCKSICEKEAPFFTNVLNIVDQEYIGVVELPFLQRCISILLRKEANKRPTAIAFYNAVQRFIDSVSKESFSEPIRTENTVKPKVTIPDANVVNIVNKVNSQAKDEPKIIRVTQKFDSLKDMAIKHTHHSPEKVNVVELNQPNLKSDLIPEEQIVLSPEKLYLKKLEKRTEMQKKSMFCSSPPLPVETRKSNSAKIADQNNPEPLAVQNYIESKSENIDLNDYDSKPKSEEKTQSKLEVQIKRPMTAPRLQSIQKSESDVHPKISKDKAEEYTNKVEDGVIAAANHQRSICEHLKSLIAWKSDNLEAKKRLEISKRRLGLLEAYISTFDNIHEKINDNDFLQDLSFQEIKDEEATFHKEEIKENTDHLVPEFEVNSKGLLQKKKPKSKRFDIILGTWI